MKFKKIAEFRRGVFVKYSIIFIFTLTTCNFAQGLVFSQEHDSKITSNGFEIFKPRLCFVGEMKTNRSISCLHAPGTDPSNSGNWSRAFRQNVDNNIQRISATADSKGRLCIVEERSDNYLYPMCTNNYQSEPLELNGDPFKNWPPGTKIGNDMTDAVGIATDGYGRWCISHTGNGDKGDIWINCNKKGEDPLLSRNWSNNYQAKQGNFQNFSSIATDGINWCSSVTNNFDQAKLFCTKAGIDPHSNWQGAMNSWDLELTAGSDIHKNASIATDGKRWCLAARKKSNQKLVVICNKANHHINQYGTMSNWHDPIEIDSGHTTGEFHAIATDGLRWCVGNRVREYYSCPTKLNPNRMCPKDPGHIRCTKAGANPAKAESWNKSIKLTGAEVSGIGIALSKSCYTAGDIAPEKAQCCEGLIFDNNSETCLAPTNQTTSVDNRHVYVSSGSDGVCNSKIVDSLQLKYENAKTHLFHFQALFSNFNHSNKIKNSTDMLIEAARFRKSKVELYFADFDQKMEKIVRGIKILTEELPQADSATKKILIKEFNTLALTLDDKSISDDPDLVQLTIQMLQRRGHQYTQELYQNLTELAYQIYDQMDIAYEQAANEQWNVEKMAIRLWRPWKMFDLVSSKYYLAPPMIKADSTPIIANFDQTVIDSHNQLGQIKIVDSASIIWSTVHSYLKDQLNSYVDRAAGIKVNSGPSYISTGSDRSATNTYLNNDELSNDLIEIAKSYTQVFRAQTEWQIWTVERANYLLQILNALEIEIAYLQGLQEVELNKDQCLNSIIKKWSETSAKKSGSNFENTFYKEANIAVQKTGQLNTSTPHISPTSTNSNTIINQTIKTSSTTGNNSNASPLIEQGQTQSNLNAQSLESDSTQAGQSAYIKRKSRREKLVDDTKKLPGGEEIVRVLQTNAQEQATLLNEMGIPGGTKKSTLRILQNSAVKKTSKAKLSKDKIPDEQIENIESSESDAVVKQDEEEDSDKSKTSGYINRYRGDNESTECHGMSCEEEKIMQKSLSRNISKYQSSEEDTIFQIVSKSYMRSIDSGRLLNKK